jgi:hypothetical protein
VSHETKYTHIHIHIHTHTYIHAYTYHSEGPKKNGQNSTEHASPGMYMYVCMYVCIRLKLNQTCQPWYVYIYVCMYVLCMYVCMCCMFTVKPRHKTCQPWYVYVCMYVCISVRICLCLYVRMYV